MFHAKRLPIGWTEKRFKYLAGVAKGRLPASGDFKPQGEKAIPYLSMEYLRGEKDEPEFVAFRSELVCANNNDILLLWDGANAGEFLRAKKGVVSSTIAKVVPYGIDADFLYWACKGQENFIRSQTTGMGIPHVSGEFLANIRMPLPDETQQRVIADYLDRETARMDALVAAKERLLKLLVEKRQALITRAVIRGLDPSVRLKPSGVEWLGDVPAHWELRRLKQWVEINKAVLPETTNPQYEFRYLEIGAVATGVVVDEPKKICFDAAPSRARRIVRDGDTIVSTVRTYLKAIWFAEETNNDLICSTGFAVLTPRFGTTPKFVGYLIQSNSFTDRITAESSGIAYPAITESQLGSFHVCVPPFAEQAAIVEYLDRETAKLDALAAKARETIALLKERRAALISAAVTGKIDIEGHACK